MAHPPTARITRRGMLGLAGGTALASAVIGGTGWQAATAHADGSSGRSEPHASRHHKSRIKAAGDLKVVQSDTSDPRLKYYRLSTPAVGWDPGVNVLLPEGYEDSGQHYPVLYLMHGGGTDADFRQWDNAMGIDIRAETADLPLIVVMPDGGHAGWYCDPTGSFAGPRNWQTFHVEQLVPWIDANFRTIAEGAGRGLSGFSMGGFGALKYMARYPDRFGSLSAHSGPASLRSQGGIVVHWANLSSAAVELAGATVYGAPWNESQVTADNPMEQLPTYQGKRVFLAAGTKTGADVPLTSEVTEAHVLNSQREFAGALDDAGIAYDRHEHGGSHQVDLDLFRADLAGVVKSLSPAS